MAMMEMKNEYATLEADDYNLVSYLAKVEGERRKLRS